MISLRLEKLKSGMVLAESAYNFQGILLLKAGATLSETNIRILKSWGVLKVSVEGESEEYKLGDENTIKEIKQKIKKELKHKFSEVSKDSVTMEIMRVAANILEQRCLMEENKDETR